MMEDEERGLRRNKRSNENKSQLSQKARKKGRVGCSAVPAKRPSTQHFLQSLNRVDKAYCNAVLHEPHEHEDGLIVL